MGAELSVAEENGAHSVRLDDGTAAAHILCGVGGGLGRRVAGGAIESGLVEVAGPGNRGGVSSAAEGASSAAGARASTESHVPQHWPAAVFHVGGYRLGGAGAGARAPRETHEPVDWSVASGI